MSHPVDSGVRTNIAPTPSTGTTAVNLGPAAATRKKVYVAGLVFVNRGQVPHTVQLLSKGSGAATVILERDVFYGDPFELDGRGGRWETEVGERLQFKIDAGGSAGDVTVSGSVVQK